MWFLAALAVLVMGGVFALAAGRGAPMSEAYDDRPDVLVPAGRPLQADDVRRVRFSLAFRGYRMSEVDALLDRLARQLDDQLDDQLDGHLADPAPGADVEPTATRPAEPFGQGEVVDTPSVPEARGEEPPR